MFKQWMSSAELRERLGMSEEECREDRGWRSGMATYLDDQVNDLEARMRDLEDQFRMLVDIVDRLVALAEEDLDEE
jgi:hypothetical protein